jgi:hypothetical protein
MKKVTGMKKTYVVAVVLGLVVLMAAPGAFARGKGKKNAAPAFQSVPSDIYKQYDKNSNGMLEADEKDTLRKDFEKEPAGALKSCDSNADGKLSDEEIAAIPGTRQIESPAPVKAKRGKKNK